MGPRRQTAGTMGIIAGVALLILTILFFTSGASPETFTDPGNALSFMRDNAGRLQMIGYLAIITVATAAIFVAGLAAALHERTPTRATATLYFGLGGLAGHGLGAFTILAAFPWLVTAAARDQVSAAHAYVAVNGLTAAADGIGNFFVGLSTLLAGWAATTTPALGPALGGFGVVAGVVTALAGLAPQVSVLYLGSFVLPVIWLVWAGYALRRSAG
jgi:Domain of unknown function (DUF4386)